MSTTESIMANTSATVSSTLTLHGFDPRTTSWESYRDRLLFYFKANRINVNDDKKALLLWAIGDTVYSLLESLVAPARLTDEEVSYDDIVAKLDQHYDSTKNIMTASFDFYSCYQKPGQSFQEWKGELCSKLKHCGFTSSCLAKKPQDRALRDMYVIGLHDVKIRQALLKETDPDLDKAERIIQTAERLQADLKQFDNAHKRNEFQVAKLHNGKWNRQNKQQQNQRNNNTNNKPSSPSKACDGCGSTSHTRVNCTYKDIVCNNCKRKGHLSRVCRQKKDSVQVKHISTVYRVDSKNTMPHAVTMNLQVNDCSTEMELDTGALHTIIDKSTWQKIGCPRIQPSKLQLRCYGGTILNIMGECLVNVKYDNRSMQLPVVVVQDPRPSLLGLNWIHRLKVDLNRIIFDTDMSVTGLHRILDDSDLQQIIHKHQNVLNTELGHCSKIKAHIQLKPDAHPKFFKSRTIPFAYMDAIRDEIQRNLSAGIIEPIDISDWAAPIVPVKKPNGKIRICGDYKVTLNPQMMIDQYPIPTIDELLARLDNGVKFTKLDLSDAYLQIELDEDSKKLVVINTPIGLFRYNRMPFGIANAPAIFQKLIDQIITGIPNTVAYLDDILITWKTTADHLQTLDTVLARLADFGLTCNPSKCSFFKDEVNYLGFIIDQHGRRPDPTRVDAIVRMPVPQNIKQLEAFIGKVNYYGNFIENFSAKCKVLNTLRQSDVTWHWSTQCQQAFESLLNEISSATLLVHFDKKLPLILSTDASQYGIGAVLAHRYSDNSERPIAHASRTLTKAEQNYSQTEKEALSIVYGIKKFHQYLAGRYFELVTDHKPLLSIFNPVKPLPVTALNRLQRWAIFLMGYSYTIQYKSTTRHSNADALSRLPAPDDHSVVDDDTLTVNFIQNELAANWPVTAAEIATATDKDQLLDTVRKFTISEWPQKVDLKQPGIRSYFNSRISLSVVNGCLLRDMQVVIPTSLRPKVLRKLHDTHIGVVKMKQLARSYCWWPGINTDIERLVRTCTPCSQIQPIPKQEFKSWDEPMDSWSRVHMDFLGPIWNSKWLVLIDAKSKFPVVIDMGNDTTGTNLIDGLEKVFDWLGPAETLGITHVTTAPYHPASNGIAERFVRSFKEALTKELNSGATDKNTTVRRILRNYRWTPHTITGKRPVELIFKHSIRTELDLMKPVVTSDTTDKSKFSIGQFVWMAKHQLNKRPQWIPAIVTDHVGSMMYMVQTTDGQRHKRHQNQLHHRFSSHNSSIDDLSLPDEIESSSSPAEPTIPAPVQQPRYPQRNRRPPDRYQP
ncbi:unnamed protein product [Adineta ricciae]|uniref:Reverse transcriptase n=1 Tax=Adineta ricciae TaxID=249248 RepID=A0A815U2U0_ADIRI|nr:unnamed protein product [Adineta ricciae]